MESIDHVKEPVMSIKMTIYSLLIATQLSFAKNNFEASDEEVAQNKAYNKTLYSFLRQHSSPKIQLIGYSTYLPDEKKDFKSIKQVLDKTINIKSDEQTLFLADNLCHTDKKLETWCHKKQIHQIHQQVDSENIITYANALHETNDEQKVIEWLDLVTNQSTYSNSFLFELSLILSKEISLFNDKNTSLFLNQDKSETLSYVKELRLIEKGLINQDLFENYHEALSYIISTGMMMAQSVSVRSFSKFCKSDKFYEQCHHIAETLKTEKTFIGQIIADSISRKLNGIIEPNRFGTKSYQKASCYSQSQDMIFAQFMNRDYARQFILDAIEYNEGQAIENLAFKVYDTVRAHGFNSDFNPHDCEKKLKGID